MFIRPAAVLILVCAAGLTAGFVAQPFAQNRPGGAWIMFAVGLLIGPVMFLLGFRLFRLGVYANDGTLTVRSFLRTVRLPASEVRSIGFRTRPGYAGIGEWVAYLEKQDGSGIWLWATEAGRSSGPPHATMARRVACLAEALGIGVTPPSAWETN